MHAVHVYILYYYLYIYYIIYIIYIHAHFTIYVRIFYVHTYVSVLYIPTVYIYTMHAVHGTCISWLMTNPPCGHVLSPWPVLGCIIYYWCVITHHLQLAFYNVHWRNIFGCSVCIDISRHTQFNKYTWTSATCTSVTEQSICAKLT